MTTPFDFDLGLTDYTGSSSGAPDFTFGNYADIESMTDGSGSNLFSDQLSGFQPSWGDKLLGGLNRMGQTGANNMGALNLGLGAITGLSDLYSSNQQMKLLRDQLGMQESQWNKNYDNQRSVTNEQYADRQRQRVAANPNAESVSSYMDKWGIK